MKVVRLAVLVIATSIVSAVSPTTGSAQSHPDQATRAEQPEGWVVSFAPRVGFFLPQRTNSGSQAAVRRPAYGMELGVTRRGSWYGARALFERSMRWIPQEDLTSRVLGDPSSPLNSSESELFETVVVDFMAYSPVYEGVRGYMFSGYGFQDHRAPDGTPILPFLVGAERARTLQADSASMLRSAGRRLPLRVGDYSAERRRRGVHTFTSP